MKSDLLIIKLGGSVITDKKKPFTARTGLIDRLGREIKSSLKSYKGDLIIVHGSGSFGHTLASKYQTHKGIINKNSLIGFSKVADTAIAINRIVVGIFLRLGLRVVSFAPLSFIVSKNTEGEVVFIDSIGKALELGFTPVIYGDVVFDKSKRGFCIFSGEMVISTLLRQISGKYKSMRVIYCTDTDGVYGKDGKTLEKLDEKSFKRVSADIKGSEKGDVTGGMLHKVKESLDVAKKFGVEIKILNGMKNEKLKRAIQNKDDRDSTLITSN